MPTLIQQLNEINPRWRDEIASDPLDAAVELGLIEPEELEDYQELDFHDDRLTTFETEVTDYD